MNNKKLICGCYVLPWFDCEHDMYGYHYQIMKVWVIYQFFHIRSEVESW